MGGTGEGRSGGEGFQKRKKKKGRLARVRGRPQARVQQHFSPIVSNNGPFDQPFSRCPSTHTRRGGEHTHAPTGIHVAFVSCSGRLRVRFVSATPHRRPEWRLYSCPAIARAGGSCTAPNAVFKYGSHCASQTIQGQDRSSFKS